MLRKKKKKSASGGEVAMPKLDFKPKIKDAQEQQGVLIACRGMEQFPNTAVLMAQAIRNRADQILLDYSQQGVAVRFRVDGIWESMPPMDRATGDGLLVILKRLCVLNPKDRKSRQEGDLSVKYKGDEWLINLVSQGTQTGERVLIRIEPKKPVLNELSELGMREKMQDQLRELLNASDSLFVFSAPQGHGLPTTWRIGLESADRFMRDFHIVEDKTLNEPEIINITKHTFDTSANESVMTVLKSLILKQPDVVVFTELPDVGVIKLMCEEVIEEHRCMVLRVQANSAVEALLALLLKYKESAQQLAKITGGILNQKLIRRLCTECRQPFQPNPQLLQKLGIPQGRVQVLYQPTIPPPPEQRVDANGKPIEIEICSKCHGRGYYGRAAIFELLAINNEIKNAALANPTPAAVLAAAKKHGFLTMQEEGILAVATGLTSVQEIQRVFGKK